MRLSLALSLVPLAVSVGAITVTEPKKGAEIDTSSSFVVKWTSVNTDASSFNIYIVNNAVYPPVNKKIASNIKTSSDSYTVDSIDVSAGHGYQIDLMSDATDNMGILAQSQQFNVTSSASSSTSSTSTSTSTSTKESSTKSSTTGTMITTTTGTSTGTTGMATTPSASGSSTSGSSTSSAANETSSAAPTASTGAGAGLVAHPVAAGLFAGAIAFAL